MATATMHKSQEKQGTWSKVFPSEQVSGQQSGLFVKKLLAVAVSNITYLRAIFPEHAFGDRCLEDLNLKVLRDDSSCPGACQVIKWLKGCFDAIEKQYLRVMVIGIYTNPDDVDTVIESYTFKFSYNNEGGVDIYRNNNRLTSAFSAAETKKATMRLLRTIVVLTQSLQSLPDDVMLTIKLLYYDDVTPADYEPPGFTAAASEIFKFEEEPINVKVGAVTTPFHTVKLRIKTDAKQFETVEDEGKTETAKDGEEAKEMDYTGPDQESEAMSFKQVSLRTRRQMSNSEPMEAEAAPNTTPARPGVDDQAVSTTGSQASSIAHSQDDQTVHCPCDCNEDDGLMVLCAHCKFWQHAVCFAITGEEDAPEHHICSSCANTELPELAPTDPSLLGLTPIAIQATCLWRRTLLCCTETDRILPTNLARRLGIEMTVASGLVNRLEKEGFLKRSGRYKKLGKLVNSERLKKEGFTKYLQRPAHNPVNEVPNQTQTQEETSSSAGTQVDDAIITVLGGGGSAVSPEPSNAKPRGWAAKRADSEIEKLTARAEEINITGQRKRGKNGNGGSQKEDVDRRQTCKKRVKTRDADNENEFEVCLSQESSQDTEKGPFKRRKASIVNGPIMV